MIDSPGPMCPANDGIKDIEKFLLLCHSTKKNSRNFLAGLSDKLKAHGKPEGLNDNILQTPLFGGEDLPLEASKLILSLTIKYLFEAKLFD